MKSIEVDGQALELYSDSSGSDRGAIIDSGTTLAYLPDDAYDKIVDTVRHWIDFHPITMLVFDIKVE